MGDVGYRETDRPLVKKATGLRKRKNTRESPMVSFVSGMLTISLTAFPNCVAEIYVNDKILRTKVVNGTLNPSWDDSFEVCVCRCSY